MTTTGEPEPRESAPQHEQAPQHEHAPHQPEDEQTVQQPTQEQPEQPTVQQPAVQQATAQQPTVQQPTVQQPPMQQTPASVIIDGPQQRRRGGSRTGTVLWGLVVFVIGIATLLRAGGAHLDMQLVGIVLIGATGLAMLVNALTGGKVRDRR